MKENVLRAVLPGGLTKKIANHIYDEMTDFAKYAFNKSHAAAYTIVSYQTAWLKYYYPVEFMAALMTSVIDNVTKGAEYIMECPENGGFPCCLRILTKGSAAFSVSGEYPLRPFGDKERRQTRGGLNRPRGRGRGPLPAWRILWDGMSNREVNKRTVESFIKSGAMDCLPGPGVSRMVLVQRPWIRTRGAGRKKLHGGGR